jgi:streptogrisin C
MTGVIEMRLLRRYLVMLAALAIVVGSIPVAAAASPSDMGPDAVAYARASGISEAEAGRRIAMQAEIGKLAERLADAQPETFAGLYIEHAPYQVVVLTTDPASVRTIADAEASHLAVTIEVRQVAYNMRQLKADQLALQERFGASGVAIDLRVKMNRVIVEVPSDAMDALSSADLQALPATAIVAAGVDPRVPTVTLRGGLHLSSCTSGWTIYYGSNTSNRGITTAGHCNNSQSYSGNPLTYQNDEHKSGNYDVQSHKLAGATYTAQFQAQPGTYRTVTAKLRWVNQNEGDWVCHYGKTTGYGCGYIVSTNDPGCVGAAGSFYVKVDSNPDGSGQDLSEGGDSGGPWFINYTALGTMSCQQGQDGIYSTVGFVEDPINAHILLG